MARKSKGKFKMEGHTLPGINQKSETANLKDGRSPSSAFQHSAMKRTGIYEIDELTGERRQISRDKYEAADGGSFIRTGKDVEYRKGVAPISKRTGERMTEEEYRKLQREDLAKDYELEGKKKQRRAAAIDATIQDKINRGLELTPYERKLQATMLKNL